MEKPAMLRQVIRYMAIGLLLLASLAGLLIPDQYWPAGWLPYREYEGQLAGQPVVLAVPPIRRATVPLEYHIEMTSGVCQISCIDHAGKIIPHTSMGRGYVMRDALPASRQLQLDPGSGTGHYLVRMGLEFHPLAPLLRRWLAGGILFVLIASLFFRQRMPAWQMALKSLFTPWQWAALTTVWALSGAFLYGALHESGHALVALASGGRVDHIVFTCLAGDRPHITLGYLPEKAYPWMQAGGVIFPILVAYAFLVVWWTLRRRLSRFAQTLLLTPPLILLFASFGSPFDDHLLGLSLCLGFKRPAGIMLVKLVPVLLTLATYAAIARYFWRRKPSIARS
jgi:hypothetical protein